MSHLTDEELILHYYGETARPDQPRVEDHLASCEACQAAHADLGRVLHLVETTPTPEAGPGFERDVWARLEPQLDANTGGLVHRSAQRVSGLVHHSAQRVGGWFAAPQWALAGGVAALLVVAFVAGRFSGGGPSAPAPTATVQVNNAPDRVLRAAVGDHLERSQMMLAELVNADPSHPEVLSGEQSRAADLVSANRLYRQSAEQSGDAAIADILEDLERVLLEIANAPADTTSGERADLQSRIKTDDLLFRVRVIASEMRQRTQTGREAGDRGKQRPPIS
ncbi:MAG: hypothetical protein ABI665_02875 [Vicinamibacterales bacterium]